MDPNNPTGGAGAAPDEDDYVETGYAGDPLDTPAAQATAAAAATAASTAEEEGYQGDNQNPATVEGEQTTLTPDVSRTLNTFYEFMGLEKGQVDLDDELRDFASLSPEDQASVLQDKLEQVRAQERQQTIADFGLDQQELQALDFYRANGHWPTAEAQAPNVSALSHDDLHRQSLRILLGETATDEQINKALESRRTSPTFADEAEAYRRQLGAAMQSQAAQQQEVEYQAFAEAVSAGVKSIKNLSGIELTPEHHAFVIEQLTKRGTDGLAPFIAQLADENKMAEIAAKALFFDSMVTAFQTQKVEQRTKTFDEIFGAQGPRVVAGAAPAGTNQRQSAGQRGHQLTNDDLDRIG